jgi:hypothetical protein
MGYRKKNLPDQSILHPQPINVCNNDTLMSASKELATGSDYVAMGMQKDRHLSGQILFALVPFCLHPQDKKMMQQSAKYCTSGVLRQ